MRAAVIDLGTNTFHLIIAEISSAGVEVIYKTNVPVRLGEGRINENVIIPAAFERGIQTLKDFKKEIDKHQVAVVKAIATSAVRSSANGAGFVASAAEQAGITIEVISGEDEAAFIFKGVKPPASLAQPPSLWISEVVAPNLSSVIRMVVYGKKAMTLVLQGSCRPTSIQIPSLPKISRLSGGG
jgi:exopolyphosphatase/pppGpp-phosphohydrolase